MMQQTFIGVHLARFLEPPSWTSRRDKAESTEGPGHGCHTRSGSSG